MGMKGLSQAGKTPHGVKEKSRKSRELALKQKLVLTFISWMSKQLHQLPNLRRKEMTFNMCIFKVHYKKEKCLRFLSKKSKIFAGNQLVKHPVLCSCHNQRRYKKLILKIEELKNQNLLVHWEVINPQQ